MEQNGGSSSAAGFQYDVFLSFRGETRHSFTRDLYNALRDHGIRTFRDTEELKTGERIADLMHKIEVSEVFVAVISENYAESKWCLREIAKMVDCGRWIIPVFYRVEVGHVKTLEGKFGEAFSEHENAGDLDRLEIESWKAALKAVGQKIGHVVKDYHAFMGNQSEPGYEDLLKDVVRYPCNLPLALEILGCLLRQRDKSLWKESIDGWRKSIPGGIKKILELSYRELQDKDHQSIFLDIACLFIGVNVEIARHIWQNGIDAIIALSNRCLIKINHEKKLEMHDLIRKMGIELVRQEKEYSRLWSHDDVMKASRNEENMRLVKGINLMNDVGQQSTASRLENLRIPNLEVLRFKGISFCSELIYPHLKWMEWHASPLKSFSSLKLEEVVVLDLSDGKIIRPWKPSLKESQVFNELKVLNLSGCGQLRSTEGLSTFPEMKLLILEGCSKLKEIHPNIEKLNKLTLLNIKDCRNLVILPDCFSNLTSLETINFLNCCHLENVPDSICYLPVLRELLLAGCSKLRCLPDSFGLNILRRLQTINLSNCSCLEKLPDSICKVPSVRKLLLAGCSRLKCLPDALGCLKNLEILIADHCKALEELPRSIGDLRSLQALHLKGTAFAQLPDSICALTNLWELDLSESKLKRLPTAIGNCKNLTILILKSCLTPLIYWVDLLNAQKRDAVDSSSENATLLPSHYVSDAEEIPFPMTCTREGFHINKIVKDVIQGMKIHHDIGYHVGISERVEEITQLLAIEDSDDVRMVCMNGIDGIGKTTLAKAVFNHVSRNFEACFFLEKVKGKDLCGCQVQLLKEIKHSLELLSYHAFETHQCEPGDEGLLKEVIRYACNMPLALQLLGGLLRLRRDKSEWRTSVDKWRISIPGDIKQILGLSYKELQGSGHEGVFLDIACFYVGMDSKIACYIWENGIDAIRALSNRCLIKTNDENRLEMHDLIRDMGRATVQDDSRLWGHNEVVSVLNDKEKMKLVEGVNVRNDIAQVSSISFCSKLSGMAHNLRWMEWHGSPLKSLSSLKLQNMVVLDLSHSKITRLWGRFPLWKWSWQENQVFTQLKVLNLSGCDKLSSTEGLSMFPNMKLLILEGCSKLEEIHPSIAGLKKLVLLNMKDCSSLVKLPDCFFGLNSLETINLSNCCHLKNLPESICKLPALTKLLLAGCSKLNRLPDSLGCLAKLEMLSADQCKALHKLPDSIGGLPSLLALHLKGTTFARLPDSVCALTNLRELDLSDSKLEKLPTAIGNARSLTILVLDRSRIEKLPDSIDLLGRLVKCSTVGCSRLQT
ncbi:Toll/interleukin-1 receptor-like protein [Nymphaea thermarum]|nr:Toll/interleukin-1 receptor-like protein [Nymphaea thermarum]